MNRRHRVGWNYGNKGSRRALRARAGSRRGRRGCPILQAPVLGAADRKRRNCLGVRCVLFEVPEVTMHEAVEILAQGSTNHFGNGNSVSCYLLLQCQL